MTKDLTQGNPYKLIVGFAIPTMLGILFQQLYSMVDTMIVGRLLDTRALAAVGATSSLFFMVIGGVTGVCSGFAIPVAQRMGGEEYSLMRRCVANSFYLAGIFALVLSAVTLLLCGDMLTLMKTPEDIYDQSYAYIQMIFLGIPATFLYNLLSATLRSLGDSKTPVVFLGISSVINIGLDYILIAYTPLGVQGAALATVLSQACSGVACLFYIKKKFPILVMTQEERALDPLVCRNLCAMGIPMGLQYSITAIGSVVLQSAVNGLGSVAVGAATAGQKLSLLFWAPADAFGNTMATYCGQNVGAMKLDRVGLGIRASCAMTSLYSVGIMVVIYVFAEPMLLCFINPEEEDIQTFLALSRQFLICTNLFLIPLMILTITRFSLQGMGFGNLAMMAGVIEMVARIILAWLVPVWGFTVACFSGPVAWIAADFFLVPAVIYSIKKLKRQQMEKSVGYMI